MLRKSLMRLKKLTYDRNMLVLFMVILTASWATSLTTPIWPLYISSLGASVLEVGYVFAISNAVAAIMQIVGGSLSDRYGRKRLNIVGTCIGIFPPVFYAFARTWFALIPWIVIASVSVGLYFPSRWALIADYSTVKNRAMTYSWMNIALLMGLTFAPFAGGLIADASGIQMPFFVCFALMSLCLVISLPLQESGASNHPTDPNQEKAKTQTFLMAALAFSAVNIIQGIGLGITSPIIPIFAEKQFMSGYTEIGILYAVGLGMASMVVQIPGGKLASRYSKKKITFLTTAFSAPFFGLFALSRSFMEATFLMFLSYAIINFSWPAYQDLMMELTPASRWGLMNGLAATCNGIGMTIGSAMSGVLWENFGMFVPFYVSALFVLVSSVPYLFLSETANKT